MESDEVRSGEKIRMVEAEKKCLEWGRVRWHLEKAARWSKGGSELAVTELMLTGADKAIAAGNKDLALELTGSAYRVISGSEDMSDKYAMGKGLLETAKRYEALGETDTVGQVVSMAASVYFSYKNDKDLRVEDVKLMVEAGQMYSKIGKNDWAVKLWQRAMDWEEKTSATADKVGVATVFGKIGGRVEVMHIVDELEKSGERWAYSIALNMTEAKKFDLALELTGRETVEGNRKYVLDKVMEGGGSAEAVDYLIRHPEIISDNEREGLVKKLIWRGELTCAERLIGEWKMRDTFDYQKALALVQTGNTESAREYARKAVKEDGSIPGAIYNAGAKEMGLDLLFASDVAASMIVRNVDAMLAAEYELLRTGKTDSDKLRASLKLIADRVKEVGIPDQSFGIALSLAEGFGRVDKNLSVKYLTEAKKLMEGVVGQNMVGGWMEIVRSEVKIGLQPEHKELEEAKKWIKGLNTEYKTELAAELAFCLQEAGDTNGAQELAEVCAKGAGKLKDNEGMNKVYSCLIFFGKIGEANKLLVRVDEEDRSNWVAEAVVDLASYGRFDEAMGMGLELADSHKLEYLVSKLAAGKMRGFARELIGLETVEDRRWELAVILADGGDMEFACDMAESIIENNQGKALYIAEDLITRKIDDEHLIRLWNKISDADAREKLQDSLYRGGRVEVLVKIWEAEESDKGRRKKVGVLAKEERWDEAMVETVKIKSEDEMDRAVQIIAKTRAVQEAAEFVAGLEGSMSGHSTGKPNLIELKNLLKKAGGTPSDELMRAVAVSSNFLNLAKIFAQLYPQEERETVEKRYSLESGEMLAQVYDGIMPQEVMEMLKTRSDLDVAGYYGKWFEGASKCFEWAMRKNLLSMWRMEKIKPGTCNTLRDKRHIYDFARYPAELMVDMAEGRAVGEKGYGHMVAPEADYNGAFYMEREVWAKLYTTLKVHDFGLVVSEAGSRVGVARRIIEAGQEFGPSAFRIFGGHGGEETVRYGNGHDGVVNVHDLDPARRGVGEAAKYYVPGSPAVFWSCHSGNDRGVAKAYSAAYGAKAYGGEKASGSYKKLEPQFSADDMFIVGFDIEIEDTGVAEYNLGTKETR